jgi:beta-xylosidase
MQKFVIFILIALTLSSCKAEIKPYPTPTNFDEYANAATQIAVLTSATATVDVQPEHSEEILDEGKSNVIFRDDFDAQLKLGWEWVNEKKENWSLTTKPGFLQINVTNGYFNLKNASNVLLYNAPQGDFILETSILFDAQESEQFAGLIVLESSENYAQTGIGFCPVVIGCVGRGIYLDIYQNAKLSLPRNSMVYPENVLFIQWVLVDGTMTVFTSKDNYSWFKAFQKPLNFEVNQVGLIAAQNTSEELASAAFDYFEIRQITP